MRRMNTLVTRSTNSFWLPYTQTSAKFLILLKKAQVSWMCLIISIDLYTAHHNSLGMSSAQNPLFVCNFSTQCICMGTGSLFVCSLHGKAWPLQRNTVFAVARMFFFLGGGGWVGGVVIRKGMHSWDQETKQIKKGNNHVWWNSFTIYWHHTMQDSHHWFT